MTYKLIALDLDGTLKSTGKQSYQRQKPSCRSWQKEV